MSDSTSDAIDAMIALAEEKADAAGLPVQPEAEVEPSPGSVSNCSACDMS